MLIVITSQITIELPSPSKLKIVLDRLKSLDGSIKIRAFRSGILEFSISNDQVNVKTRFENLKAECEDQSK